jgi:hypothetical protein
MRKIVIALALAVATLAAVAAPSAQAQTYPTVSNVTPFTADCNFMSRPGYLRYRYFTQTNGAELLTYEQAARIVAEQGG